MAKSHAHVEQHDDEVPFDADRLLGVSLDEVPDEHALLASGRWKVQFVSYFVNTFVTKAGVPMTTAKISLDPVEPIAVDNPNEDYQDKRISHTLWLNKPSDDITAKQFLRAFGLPAGLRLAERAEDGTVIYPAFEAVKSNYALATATERVAKGGKNKGQPEIVLSDFAAVG